MMFNLKHLFFGVALAAFSLLGTLPSGAANPPPSPSPVSILSGTATLPVTNASARVALPSSAVSAIAVTVCNTGSKVAFFKLGTSSVTALTTDFRVPPGTGVALYSGANTHLAGITGGSDTTTFDIYQGNGPLAQCPPVSGSGGVAGAVTIADGGSVALGTTTDGACSNDTNGAGTCTALQRLSRIASRLTTAIGNFLAQGSTTSGQLGQLQMCAATTGAPTTTTGNTYPCAMDTHGGIRTVAQDTNGTVADYTLPSFIVPTQDKVNGATQSGASANGANAQQTATMAAQSGKTNYLCNVLFSSGGATAGSSITPTLTGLLGGTRTLTMTLPTGVTNSAQPIVLAFRPCLPASGTNVAITGVIPAAGAGNTGESVDIEGYFQ